MAQIFVTALDRCAFMWGAKRNREGVGGDSGEEATGDVIPNMGVVVSENTIPV
ncbi:hypothetical protein C1H46_011100 [Malus baccata]|uniref:Uncharacterized protein n=1 Tax=Malus baccata TaxID=106549 RepID=A0A540MWY0_MALBA|nr:hypothetical protein C1H46_011100 [Malus baccata]